MKLNFPKKQTRIISSQVRSPEKIHALREANLFLRTLGALSAGTQASADFFNNGVPSNHPIRVSRQTVWLWARGIIRISDSRLRIWKRLFPTTDPRYQLAIEIQQYREAIADESMQ